MDTTKDMLRLVEVRLFLFKVWLYECASFFSQKILHNSKHVDDSKQPFMQKMYAKWNYFVERCSWFKAHNKEIDEKEQLQRRALYQQDADASRNPCMQRMYAMWNYFVENALGLKPNSKEDTNQQDEGAFELLRV